MIYGESSRAQKARNVLLRIEDGSLHAWTSMLTRDEVVWVVLKTLGRPGAFAIGEKLIRFPNLRLVALDEEVLIKAQSLVEEYELGPRDALHATTALLKRVDAIVSDDNDLDRVKEKRRVILGSFS